MELSCDGKEGMTGIGGKEEGRIEREEMRGQEVRERVGMVQRQNREGRVGMERAGGKEKGWES